MTIPYETPLHFALIWMVARDQDLLLKLLEESESSIEEILEKHGRGVTLPQVCSDDQFKTLVSALLDKGFGLRGTAFERGPHIEEVGLFDPPFAMERDVDRIPVPRRIKLETAGKLTIEVTRSEFRLRPTDWLLNGGWLWRSVEVFWPEVLEAFQLEQKQATPNLDQGVKAAPMTANGRDGVAEPANADMPSQEPAPGLDPVNDPAMEKDGCKVVIQAFESLSQAYKNVLRAFLIASKEQKFPFSKPSDRNAAIQKAHPGGFNTPSPSTIYRAFNVFKRKSGIDLNENDRARLFLTEHISK